MLCNVKIGTVFTYLILLKIGVTGCTVSCNYPQNLNEKDELSCQKQTAAVLGLEDNIHEMCQCCPPVTCHLTDGNSCSVPTPSFTSLLHVILLKYSEMGNS